MNKELTIEFLNRVIFHLSTLRRVANDTDNRRLLDEVHAVYVEADTLRERLFSELEEQQ